jgi:hypothetical protein
MGGRVRCTGEANYFRDYKRLGVIAKLATSYNTEIGMASITWISLPIAVDPHRGGSISLRPSANV